jgi:hypothetical protein
MATDILSIPGPTLEEMENTRQGTSGYTGDQMGQTGDQPTTLAPLEGTVQRRPTLQTERGQSWFGAGEKESYFMQLIHGANDLIAGSGDLLINSFIDGVSSLKEDSANQGLDPKTREENPQLSRDYLQRFFNRGDYESIEYIFPKLADWFMNNAPNVPEGSVAADVGKAITAWNKYGAGEQIGPPQNWQSKILRTGGEMGAAAIPFVGVTGRTALAAQKVPGFLKQQQWLTEKAVREGSKWFGGTSPILQQAVTQPYRSALTGGTSIATPALVEGLYGIASGAGMQTETELFGTHSGVGALVPLALPASLMWLARHGPTGWAIRNIYAGGKKVVEMGQTKIADKKFEQDPSLIATAEDKVSVAARNQVAKQIEEVVATPAAQESIDRAKQLELALDPYAEAPVAFSPAEATGDPALIAMQAAVEAKAPLGSVFSAANLARKNNILEAAARFKEDKLSGNPETDAPAIILDAATKKRETAVGIADKEEGILADQLDIISAIDGSLPPIAIAERAKPGIAIRQRIIDARATVDKEATKLAKKLNINDADQLASADSVNTAKESLESYLPRQGTESLSYKNMPKVFKNFLDHKFVNGRMSFQDWKMFRGQVGSALSEAVAQGRNNDVRALMFLTETLDNLASAPKGALSGTAKKFEEFRDWYKVNYAPFDPVLHILTPKVQGSSSYILQDESVANAFLASRESAGVYKGLYGEDPAMMEHIRAAALDSARSFAVRTPTATGRPLINADRYNTWINKNGDTLDELGFLPEFQDTQRLIQGLSDRNLTLVNRRKHIDGNSLFRAIAKSENKNNPDQLIADIFAGEGNVRLAQELRQVAAEEAKRQGNPGILEAWNYAVIRKIFKQQPNFMDNPINFKTYLANNERVLDAALTPEHFDNMYLLADAYERALATALKPGSTETRTFMDLFAQELGVTPANVTARILAVREGRLGRHSGAAYFLGRAVNAQSMKRVNTLWQAAIMDETLARNLTQNMPEGTPVGSITPKVRDYINLYLFNTGVPFGEDFYKTEGEGEPFGIRLEGPIAVPPPDPRIKIKEIDVPGPQTQATPPEVSSPVNIASGPTAPTSGVNVAELFPFDPTSQAIARRREAPKAGLESLMG